MFDSYKLLVPVLIGLAGLGYSGRSSQEDASTPATLLVVQNADDSPFQSVTDKRIVEETRNVLATLKQQGSALDSRIIKWDESLAKFNTLVSDLEDPEADDGVGSFKSPTTGVASNCVCMSEADLRELVYEEVQRALSTNPKSSVEVGSVIKGVKEAVVSTPVVSSTVYPTSPVYNSGGSTGTVTYSSSYPVASGGSTGTVYSSPTYSPSYSTTTPSYSVTPAYSSTNWTSVPQGTFYSSSGQMKSTNRTALGGGNFFGNRYYTNASGCTVDRRTGKVVSCPNRR